MDNYLYLLQGEILRMKKYNILAASLVVAALWIGVLYFTDLQEIDTIFPLLLFIDVTSMAIVLIGATMIFEKEEGALKAMLVTPITKIEYILAKTSSNLMSNLLTFILLYLYARTFKALDLNPLWLLGAVLVVGFFHSMLGFILSYYSKTFTDLLMGMMKYFFLMMLPVLFELLGLITNQFFLNLFYLLPTKASMILLLSPTGTMERWEILLSLMYLLALSWILFYLSIKKFDSYAVRESGV